MADLSRLQPKRRRQIYPLARHRSAERVRPENAESDTFGVDDGLGDRIDAGRNPLSLKLCPCEAGCRNRACPIDVATPTASERLCRCSMCRKPQGRRQEDANESGSEAPDGLESHFTLPPAQLNIRGAINSTAFHDARWPENLKYCPAFCLTSKAFLGRGQFRSLIVQRMA